MNCPYCKGVPGKYRGNQTERLPLVDMDVDCDCLGTAQLALYVNEGYINLTFNHGVNGRTVRKTVAINCCPICKRDMIPAVIEPDDDETDYSFLEDIE